MSSKYRRRPRKKKRNKKLIILAVVLLAVVITVIVGYHLVSNSNAHETIPNDETTLMTVLLETSMGNITIQLRNDMPITTENFKNLVQQGVYDNTTFHRVIADFMIQGGDPSTGNWSGGTIPYIQDELSTDEENRKNLRGTVSMAKVGDPTTGRAEPNSGSSQFFINVVDNSNDIFDEDYPVFGDVIDGMNVVDAISNVPTDSNDKPIDDVILIWATLID